MSTKIEWCNEITEKLIKRFWSYVDIRTSDECWEWQRGLFGSGYGQFRIGKYKVRTHRIAFFLRRGYLPFDKIICHTCDNPKCCNPKHLFDGTHKDNAVDRERKGRGGDGGSFIKKLTGQVRGVNNPAHKLTTIQADEIRYLRDTRGFTYRRLAKLYKVSQSQIGNIINKRNWK